MEMFVRKDKNKRKEAKDGPHQKYGRRFMDNNEICLQLDSYEPSSPSG